MSDQSPPSPSDGPSPSSEAPGKPTPAAGSSKPAGDGKRRDARDELQIIVRPLPKVIFFYPLAAISLIFALFPEPGVLAGQVWMGIFFFNLLVIAADFNEERSLIFALTGIAALLGLLYFDVLGSVTDWLASLEPLMNRTFYAMIFVGFAVLFLEVWIRSRFNYWTFRPNEVVHRYGLFPKMKRYSTEDLRWDKEVPDVLERLLAGTGRIILTTPHERHPIIIEHVVRIGAKDDKIADLLGVKAVVHTDKS